MTSPLGKTMDVDFSDIPVLTEEVPPLDLSNKNADPYLSNPEFSASLHQELTALVAKSLESLPSTTEAPSIEAPIVDIQLELSPQISKDISHHEVSDGEKQAYALLKALHEKLDALPQGILSQIHQIPAQPILKPAEQELLFQRLIWPNLSNQIPAIIDQAIQAALPSFQNMVLEQVMRQCEALISKGDCLAPPTHTPSEAEKGKSHAEPIN